MANRFLLDTNTASYIIKSPTPSIRDRLMKIPLADVAVSAVTEAELRFGVARRPDAAGLKTAVDEFLLRVETLPWDSRAARDYAIVRAELERTGRLIGNLDMMIAAHAISIEAVLVTADAAFRRVRNLRIEDWTKR